METEVGRMPSAPRWRATPRATLRCLGLSALIAFASGCTTFDSAQQRDELAWQYGDPVPSWWRGMPGRCAEAKIHRYNWSYAACRAQAIEARRAETLGSVHESAVGLPMRPDATPTVDKEEQRD